MSMSHVEILQANVATRHDILVYLSQANVATCRDIAPPQSAKSSSASAWLRRFKKIAPFSGTLMSRLSLREIRPFRYEISRDRKVGSMSETVELAVFGAE